MKFIITVDVEADNQWKADKRKNITLENIKEIPRFQALCEKYGFKPTYLATFEVASDKTSIDILKGCLKNNNAEIGAHLHPWTNPPFAEKAGDTVENIYPSELSDIELNEKLNRLTEKIKESFGFNPTSFRAGRWGFDTRMIGCLSRLDYIVDCSITPKIDWSKVTGKSQGSGGPDFRRASVYPYVLSETDVCAAGQSNILEIPMTILYIGIFNSEKSLIKKYYLRIPDSFLKKAMNKLFFRLNWCRIFPEKGFADLKKMHEVAQKNNLPVMEFMIHSSEFLPGGSPYTKTKDAVENMYLNFEKFLKYLNEKNISGITLSEYAKMFKKNNAN